MKYSIIALSVVSILTGCGGGGGGDEKPEPKPAPVEKPTAWVFKVHNTTFLTITEPTHSTFFTDFIPVDVNGDGFIDIVSDGPDTGNGPDFWTGNDVPLTVLVNQGDQTFIDDPSAMFNNNSIPTQIHTRTILQADFNLDGLQDIYFSGAGRDVYPWSGEQGLLVMSEGDNWIDASINLNWTVDTYGHTSSVGDVNGDNYPDILVMNHSDHEDIIAPLLNDGNGNFTHNPEIVPAEYRNSLVADNIHRNWQTSKLADLDGDGCPDLMLSATTDPMDNFISWNLCGDAGFTDRANSTTIPKPSNPIFTMINDFHPVDINNDGLMDVLIANNTKDYKGKFIQVMINKGNRVFEDQADQYFPFQATEGDWAARIHTVDFDRDGDLDITLLTSGRYDIFDKDDNLLWENRNGVFHVVANNEISGMLMPIDVDNDGDVDLVSREILFGSVDKVKYRLVENLSIN